MAEMSAAQNANKVNEMMCDCDCKGVCDNKKVVDMMKCNCNCNVKTGLEMSVEKRRLARIEARLLEKQIKENLKSDKLRAKQQKFTESGGLEKLRKRIAFIVSEYQNMLLDMQLGEHLASVIFAGNRLPCFDEDPGHRLKLLGYIFEYQKKKKESIITAILLGKNVLSLDDINTFVATFNTIMTKAKGTYPYVQFLANDGTFYYPVPNPPRMKIPKHFDNITGTLWIPISRTQTAGINVDTLNLEELCRKARFKVRSKYELACIAAWGVLVSKSPKTSQKNAFVSLLFSVPCIDGSDVLMTPNELFALLYKMRWISYTEYNTLGYHEKKKYTNLFNAHLCVLNELKTRIAKMEEKIMSIQVCRGCDTHNLLLFGIRNITSPLPFQPCSNNRCIDRSHRGFSFMSGFCLTCEEPNHEDTNDICPPIILSFAYLNTEMDCKLRKYSMLPPHLMALILDFYRAIYVMPGISYNMTGDLYSQISIKAGVEVSIPCRLLGNIDMTGYKLELGPYNTIPAGFTIDEVTGHIYGIMPPSRVAFEVFFRRAHIKIKAEVVLEEQTAKACPMCDKINIITHEGVTKTCKKCLDHRCSFVGFCTHCMGPFHGTSRNRGIDICPSVVKTFLDQNASMPTGLQLHSHLTCYILDLYRAAYITTPGFSYDPISIKPTDEIDIPCRFLGGFDKIILSHPKEEYRFEIFNITGVRNIDIDINPLTGYISGTLPQTWYNRLISINVRCTKLFVKDELPGRPAGRYVVFENISTICIL